MRAVINWTAVHPLLFYAALPESRWLVNSRDCPIRRVHCSVKAHSALLSYRYRDRLQARCFSQGPRTIVDCASTHIEEGAEGAMGYAKSNSTASSSTKRKRNAPTFYAVKVGYTPGIYQSWDEAKLQTLKAQRLEKRGKSKYYGVQVGHVPGVYTEWPAVLEQVTGYKGGKQKRFESWEEAQAYVNEAQGTAPSDTSTPISLQGHLNSTTPSVVESRKSSKKQKQNDGSAVIPLSNGEYEPGMGPLPLEAEDGFDRTIKHGPPNGPEVERKTQEELNLRKLQPTGDFEGTLEIYTDGASKGNGQLGAYAGFGIWFGPNDARDLIEPILTRIREREMARAKTNIVWVKAHNGNTGNEAADRLANEGAEEKRIELEMERLTKAVAEREQFEQELLANGFLDDEY
ncbi:hypothetical protein N0V90_010864 [Kalmusia sp. IMI 367209]|nr:hypothetical protein N0V90_010864 [Kalmusia sp. IMI 367209]